MSSAGTTKSMSSMQENLTLRRCWLPLYPAIASPTGSLIPAEVAVISNFTHGASTWMDLDGKYCVVPFMSMVCAYILAGIAEESSIHIILQRRLVCGCLYFNLISTSPTRPRCGLWSNIGRQGVIKLPLFWHGRKRAVSIGWSVPC